MATAGARLERRGVRIGDTFAEALPELQTGHAKPHDQADRCCRDCPACRRPRTLRPPSGYDGGQFADSEQHQQRDHQQHEPDGHRSCARPHVSPNESPLIQPVGNDLEHHRDQIERPEEAGEPEEPAPECEQRIKRRSRRRLGATGS